MKNHILRPGAQSGFGLLEALVAMAIVAITLGALMAILSTLQKERRAGQESISKNELYLNVSKALLNDAICLAAVNGGSSQQFNANGINGGPNPFIRIPRIPSAAGGSDFIVQVDEAFSPTSNWVTAQDIRLTKFRVTGVPDYYRASFIIQINPAALVRALAAIEIPVLIRTDPASPVSAKHIVGCGMEDDFRPGEHCGAYVAGADYNGTVLCKGLDPSVSCPPGFKRVGGDYQSPGNRWFVTCVKE